MTPVESRIAAPAISAYQLSVSRTREDDPGLAVVRRIEEKRRQMAIIEDVSKAVREKCRNELDSLVEVDVVAYAIVFTLWVYTFRMAFHGVWKTYRHKKSTTDGAGRVKVTTYSVSMRALFAMERPLDVAHMIVHEFRHRLAEGVSQQVFVPIHDEVA